ncbi:hypothetical protein [Amorphus sp. 3PC139-8]|uniref:hypothetical protein n=1 Tax=Amorphus sp. 3PC139-8 TaxID=2735676 RepID=UPI00345DD79C
MRDRPAVYKLIRNMRLSVEENSSPYGFSVMITGSYALLNTLSPPDLVEVLAGSFGAASAFVLAEVAALTFLEGPATNDSQKTRLLGRLLSFISIGCGMSTAYLCGLLINGPLGWLLAGAASAFVYLLLDGLQLTVADYRARDD